MPTPRIAGPLRQEAYFLAYDHAQVTADTTVKLDKVPSGRTLRIDSVQYINPTGLAEHADNHFTIKLMNGSTIVASLTSDADATAGDDSIVADTFTALTLSATDANRVYAGGDVLSLLLDEGGTATLPPGRIVVRGRYV